MKGKNGIENKKATRNAIYDDASSDHNRTLPSNLRLQGPRPKRLRMDNAMIEVDNQIS